MLRQRIRFLAVVIAAADPPGGTAQGPPPFADFGLSVAIASDTIAVVARKGGAGSPVGGAIHLFERKESAWVEGDVLPVPEAKVEDPFGISMAADGATIVVGAQFAHDRATNAGLAYVFERRGQRWHQAGTLYASDAAADDQFGLTVSVSGNTIVVGARLRDDRGHDAGAAYLFERSGGVWAEVAKLTASDAAPGDLFGRASLDGDTLIVSADLNDDRGRSAGKAYVYQRQRPGTWAEAAILHASDGAAGDELGITLALNGRTAVFAAMGRDGSVADSGAAYVFEEEDGRWTETARLEPGDATPAHAFGLAIAAAHETIVIGAPYHAAAGERAGAVYVFERRDGRWTETAKLTPSDPAPGRGFGATVAVSNGTIVVGVRGAANGRNPGAVYVFERRSGKWVEAARLASSVR
jgi:FG-GAP repeat